MQGKRAMHVLPKVILHHAHLQTIFFRETKTKFLCRTKLTGALGAILAQAPRAPEKWFSFFCAFQFFSSRAVMFPAQSVAMRWGGLGDIKTYYQLPPEVWNAFVEMAGDPGDDLKLLAALPPEVVAASLSRAKLGDGEYLTAVHASHVGLVYRLARRILHVKGGGDWDQWGGYFTMARHFHNTFGSYTNGNSCSIYGKETEDDADLGSRRRWRFCGGARGHEGKVVSTIPPNHGRMAPRGGGGAVIRTAFRLTQADERSRHCTIRGLCNICPVWSTCIASFKVSNIRGITEWLRDEGTTWSGVFPSVESLLQGIPHCDVDAGCNDDVYASQLRSNDRKAEPFVPFSLAFGLLSRRVGQIITLEQDEIQDHYGHQEWHPTSKKLGPVQTLGPHLPKSNSGQFWQTQVHGPALAWVASGSRGLPKTPAEQIASLTMQGGTAAIAPTVEVLERSPRRKLSKKEKKENRKKRGGEKEEESPKKTTKGGEHKESKERQKRFAWNNGNGPCGELQPGQACVAKIKREHKCTICNSPGHPSRSCPQKQKQN